MAPSGAVGRPGVVMIGSSSSLLVLLMLATGVAFSQQETAAEAGARLTTDSGQAAGWGPSSVAGSAAGYVDPALCATCHPRIAETYRHTGMGRSFFRIAPEKAEADFSNHNSFYHAGSGRYYRAYRRDGKYYLRRHQIGFDGRETNLVEKEIHYVLGSGNHARSYLHRTPQGRLLQLPLTWYAAEGGYWAMAPGYDRPDHVGFRREVDFECMFCHNGYPEMAPDADKFGRSPLFPGWIPEGIDCQRCHGPGRTHVHAAQQGAAPESLKESILNPARLSTERQLEICMQCHLETTSRSLPHAIRRYERGFFSYRPGEPLEDYVLHFDYAPGSGYEDRFEVVNAVYRLRKSPCFQQSEGELTCSTCHNPHEVRRGEQAVQHHSAVCRSCHDQTLARRTREKAHVAAQECLSCHMPKRRTEDAVHVVMRDHLIQRFKPDRDLLAHREEVPDPAKLVKVALYYPVKLPDKRESELYQAVAQVKDQSNLVGGIPLLRAALRRHTPRRAEFTYELAEAYRQAGQNEKAVPLYEKVIERASDFWPAGRGLGMVLSASGHLARAREVLEGALPLAPDEPSLLNLLGDVYYRLGKLDDAVATLQKAAVLHPDLPEAHNNLGTVYAMRNKPVASEATLREAIRHRPNFAAAHNNLANLLARKGDSRQAAYHFEKALEIDPAYVEARENYALALARAGQLDAARDQLETAIAQRADRASLHNVLGLVLFAERNIEGAIRSYRVAIEINPKLAGAHFNLGMAYRQLGNRSKAKNHFERALEEKPDYFEAHLRLGEVLASEGRNPQAARHFEQAQHSPNPRLRKAATQRLAAITKN